MQGIMRPIERHRRGHSTICGRDRTLLLTAAGTTPSAGVMTLAPAFSRLCQSLVGVRTDYTHEATGTSFQLCAALVHEGLGDQNAGSRLVAVRFDLRKPRWLAESATSATSY